MFSFFKKMIQKPYKENNVENRSSDTLEITKNFEENIDLLKSILGESKDIIFNKINIGDQNKIKAVLIFIEGMVNKDLINEDILKPLMFYTTTEQISKYKDMKSFRESLLTTGDVRNTKKVLELVDNLLYGDTLLLVENFEEALIISTKDWEKRSITEPQTDVSIRGPREGFTETLKINMTLLRRKIINPNLTFESFRIGKNTNTYVSIAYLKNIASPNLVKKVQERLKKIQIDEILDSGFIEELVEDSKHSIFPTIANSERPDIIASKILEGRVAILVDGSPIVLSVPMLFIEPFQSPEDYYSRPYFSSFIRLLRFWAFTISILAPAAYVALSTFHQELIPTKLLVSMAKAHEGVPFTAFVESLIMIITFEILKEAGVRLPRPVGQAVSIVGALVIGESAVSAGLIGEPMVIVISITAISSFVVPALNDTIVLLRLAFILLASFFGAFGILTGLLITLIHVVTLKSFGTPYFYPIAPFNLADMKDTLIRTRFKNTYNKTIEKIEK